MFAISQPLLMDSYGSHQEEPQHTISASTLLSYCTVAGPSFKGGFHDGVKCWKKKAVIRFEQYWRQSDVTWLTWSSLVGKFCDSLFDSSFVLLNKYTNIFIKLFIFFNFTSFWPLYLRFSLFNCCFISAMVWILGNLSIRLTIFWSAKLNFILLFAGLHLVYSHTYSSSKLLFVKLIFFFVFALFGGHWSKSVVSSCYDRLFSLRFRRSWEHISLCLLVAILSELNWNQTTFKYQNKIIEIK